MADESIIVKNQGTIFLGGPPLVMFPLILYLICLEFFTMHSIEIFENYFIVFSHHAPFSIN